MEATGLKAVRLLYAAFNNGDFEGMTQLFHPEVVMIVRDENGNDTDEGPYRGVAEIRDYFESVQDRVHRPFLDVGVITEHEGRVIASLTVRGSLQPSGAEGSMPAVHVFSFTEGLIREIHSHRPPWERLAPDKNGP